MTNIIDKIRAKLSGGAPQTSADLTDAAAQARALIVDCDQQIAALQSGRRDLLLSLPTDEQLKAHDDRLADAMRQRDRGAALIEVLEQRATEAKAEQEERAREAVYEKAERLTLDFEKIARKAWPKAVELIHATLRAYAEAQGAINTANAALPAGREKLPQADHFRGLGGWQEAEIIEEEVVDLWVSDHDNRIASPEMQSKIYITSGSGLDAKGVEKSRQDSYSHSQVTYHREQVVRLRYLERFCVPGVNGLAQDLNLPGLMSVDPHAFRGRQGMPPREILAQLTPDETIRPKRNVEQDLVQLHRYEALKRARNLFGSKVKGLDAEKAA